MSNRRSAAILLMLLCAAGLCTAQPVIHLPDSTGGLEARMRKAFAAARQRASGSGCWIGYSIERLMGENSYIGSHHADPQRNRPTLEEIVTGVTRESMPPELRSGDVSTMNGSMTFDDERRPRKLVRKDIGILAHYAGQEEPDEVLISNFSLHVELKNEPLYWVGPAEQDASLSWLGAVFHAAQTVNAKESMVTAIGLHEHSEATAKILGGILTGDEKTEVRKEAAFWLGQTNRGDALALLMKTARNDPSGDLRDQAVFAAGEMEGEAAVDSLIGLARHGGKKDVRSKAIFWLGQKASRKASAAINGILEEDGDSEVQKSALYALNEFPRNEGLDMLIRVAKTHRNREVRKTAIYLIAESEDPRAVEALVELIRN